MRAVLVGLLLVGCGDSFQTGASTTTGAGGGGGSGGEAPSDPIGCSDGTRELYTDRAKEPDVAGCSGAFGVAGVSTPSQCDRMAGDGLDGAGCSAADLCARGWHVCKSSADFAASVSDGACPLAPPGTFWATQQATGQTTACDATGVNNLVGCGTPFPILPGAGCAPLDSLVTVNECTDLAGWECGPDSQLEAEQVYKPSAADGGVLCCRD
jgi:hypothetical protein